MLAIVPRGAPPANWSAEDLPKRELVPSLVAGRRPRWPRSSAAPVGPGPRATPAGGPRPPDWAELVPELGTEQGDLVITKRQWAAFYGTELDLQLRRRGIDTILLAGISTNVGVESTARDAYERGYEQVFLEDAMAARNPDEHAHTIRAVFARIGRLRSTAEVLAALEAGTAKA
jgi:nicotinamidase-related amidase